ncbi:probable glutamate receptor [Trichogramma pretiosum]|uniref:probable glutamate receptor n=1 Tax=Trichogramma pretiosum TaxID=7493 RepID=UPI000C71C410|nr:probable glutamate receptor [Trichogramma pretiosum]
MQKFLPLLLCAGGVISSLGGKIDLVDFLRSALDARLYSSRFSALQIFTCGRAKNERQLQPLRGLATSFLGPIRSIGVDEFVNRSSRVKDSEHRLTLDSHRALFILDLDCSEDTIERLVEAADAGRLFSTPYKWLLISQNENISSQLGRLLASRDIYPSSEVVAVSSSGRVVSVYRTSKESRELLIEDIGHWDRGGGALSLSGSVGDVVAWRRRKNLRGTALKSSLVITNKDTINHLTDYQDKHIDTITKSNYPWALLFVQMFNATVSFDRVGTWGYLSANGSWGGMIGQLQRGEIDFGGTGTFLVGQRIGVVQYISLTTTSHSRFVFRRPPLSSISNLFRLPFGRSVWLGALGLLLLLAGLLYPAMRLEWLSTGRDKRESLNEPNPPSLSDDLIVVLGAVSQQGSWYEPRSMPTRLIYLMALLAALNLYAAYAANIVALLQSTTSSINDLRDLLDSPLTLAVHDTVFNRHYFGSFKDPVRRSVYEDRICSGSTSKKCNWYGIEEGIERVRRGQFAFHVVLGAAYKIVAETYAEDEKCDFHEIDYLNQFDPHFVIPVRSPYVEHFRVGALKLHETGLRGRELDRLYAKRPSCGSSRRFLSVGLTECYGAFYLLVYGAALALGLLCLEIAVDQVRRRRRLRRQLTNSSIVRASPLPKQW